MSENQFQRPAKTQRRVVVTGLGALTPLGVTATESWEKALAGESGIRKVESFDPSRLTAQIGGEVRGFEPTDFISKKDLKKMDRFIQLAIAASDEAIKDSGLDFSDEALAKRTGCFVGVGIGGLPQIVQQHKISLERGPSRISPFFIPATISNLASGQLSIMHGLKGPNFALTSACASGANAIGEATRYIRDGHCDVMVTGGSESAVCELALGGFASMKALSTNNENPAAASRPFDRDRDGFVLSEASGMIILEDYERASKRGAKIYAEVTGYASSSDGYHLTTPHPEGFGACNAMKWALQDARLNPDQIDYINAHATSTPAGDEVEVKAVHQLFGDHAQKLSMSSTKSMTGHALGAAGAIEAVFCLQAVKNGVMPPTINLDNPSEACDLDFVAGEARQKDLKHVINNSFGFGGTNASLVFSQL